MRGSLAIGISVGIAAVFTHGVVYSGVNFSDSVAVSSYVGVFRQILLGTERLWSYAHGWQPLSHIQDFGRFYAPLVHLICPLLGFALFRILSGHRLGVPLWKPLAIAALLTMTPDVLSGAPPEALPWWEAARTAVIVLAMALAPVYGFPLSRARCADKIVLT